MKVSLLLQNKLVDRSCIHKDGWTVNTSRVRGLPVVCRLTLSDARGPDKVPLVGKETRTWGMIWGVLAFSRKGSAASIAQKGRSVPEVFSLVGYPVL